MRWLSARVVEGLDGDDESREACAAALTAVCRLSCSGFLCLLSMAVVADAATAAASSRWRCGGCDRRPVFSTQIALLEVYRPRVGALFVGTGHRQRGARLDEEKLRKL